MTEQLSLLALTDQTHRDFDTRASTGESAKGAGVKVYRRRAA